MNQLKVRELVWAGFWLCVGFTVANILMNVATLTLTYLLDFSALTKALPF